MTYIHVTLSFVHIYSKCFELGMLRPYIASELVISKYVTSVTPTRVLKIHRLLIYADDM